MAYFALFDQLVQGTQGFLDRRHGFTGVAHIAQLAEEIGAAVRPVHLVQIDIIRLQALQAVFTGLADVFPGQPGATTQVAQAITGACHLAGNHQVIPLAPAGQPVAQIGFGQALGFSPGRHRVHLGGVDKVDAGAGGVVQLLKRFLLGILFAPGHGAQANQTDIDVGVSKFSRLHEFSSFA